MTRLTEIPFGSSTACRQAEMSLGCWRSPNYLRVAPKTPGAQGVVPALENDLNEVCAGMNQEVTN